MITKSEILQSINYINIRLRELECWAHTSQKQFRELYEYLNVTRKHSPETIKLEKRAK